MVYCVDTGIDRLGELSPSKESDMTTITVERVFAKRETAKSDWEGRIGVATLVVDYESATLMGEMLSEKSFDYLLNFSLQSMQDAYAGAQSLDEAIASFEKKRAAIIDGSIGTRASGSGASVFVTIARSIVKAACKTQWGAKSEKWAKLTGLSDDDQDAKLDAMYAANESAFRPKVEAEIVRRAEANAAKKSLANVVELDL